LGDHDIEHFFLSVSTFLLSPLDSGLWNDKCRAFLVFSENLFDGNRVNDISGYSNDAVIQGRYSWISTSSSVQNSDMIESVSKHLRLEPAAQVVIASAPSLDIVDQLTVELWLKSELSDKYDSSSFIINQNGMFSFPRLTQTKLFGSLFLKSQTIPIEAQISISRPSFRSKTNESWHHFALTFNGKDVCVFVDGQRVFYQTLKVSDELQSSRPQISPLTIGGPTTYDIAALRVWSIALDQSQISSALRALNEDSIPFRPAVSIIFVRPKVAIILFC
jgi:hypothetical protein